MQEFSKPQFRLVAVLLTGAFLIGPLFMVATGDAQANQVSKVSVDDLKSRLQGYPWADGDYDDASVKFTLELRENKANHFRQAAEAEAISVTETYNYPSTNLRTSSREANGKTVFPTPHTLQLLLPL